MENILEKINKSAIKFLAPLKPISTYQTIVREAVKLVDAEYGSILLEQEGELRRVYGSIKMAYTTRNRKRGNTYKSFIEQKVIVAPIKELGPLHPELQHYGIKWTIFIPLSYQKKSIGVLTINTKKEERIDKKQFNGLKLYGTLASLAIINAKALDEAQKAIETRDLFISLASHELKTPLTSVMGYVQLIQKKSKSFENFPTNITDNLSRETNRLASLIRELLEINQVKSGGFRFNFIECSLNEIIQTAVTDFKMIYPKRKIIYKNSIKSPTDLIIGDSNKLMQVILNVLQNAVKFSDESTEIKLALKEEKQFYIFSIQDKGKGIAKSDLPHIFKDFYKGKGNTAEGMGLGLFLTKHIIESHRGTIKVISHEGAGTKLIIKIPKMRN